MLSAFPTRIRFFPMLAAVSAGLLLPGCGWDSLLFSPHGYHATPAPQVVLTGTAEGGAALQVLSRDGRTIAQTTAAGDGAFRLELPPSEDGTNLRVFARNGSRTTKAIVASAPKGGEPSAIGALDAAATARAQLATYEITQQAGSSFAGAPPTAVRALLTALTSSRTPALDALTGVVADLLKRAPADDQGPALFNPIDWTLDGAFLSGHGLDAALLDQYKTAVADAARGYSLQIQCDPTHLNAMFTVDVSGQARDGNGTPQLIRQPNKEARVYFGFTADESSTVNDPSIPRSLKPNDPTYAMTDDGQNGDEVAGDGIFTVVVPLPRGARIQYKYTNGAAGSGFTGAEEWPGNSRILEVSDVLTGRPDGQPDCLIVRRDSFGDEASNKNFVNLNTIARAGGGTVDFNADLGGDDAPLGRSGLRVGGLARDAIRTKAPLTPKGVPEARENGVCQICPPPLVLDPDDRTAPTLVAAERTAVDRVRVSFSKPLRADDARDVSHYAYVDDTGRSVLLLGATPSGSDVILETAPVNPIAPARLRVHDMRDVSVHENRLDQASTQVLPDRTPPKVLSVRARSMLDLDPSAKVGDPTVGTIVELIFDELPEQSGASDPTRFQIAGLNVLGAQLVSGAPVPTVRLATAPQEKGASYHLHLSGVRDLAGNALDQDQAFPAFALYKVTFGVVPGFAYASSDGKTRGIPRNEKLYLTGTALGAARDLQGYDISVTSQGATRVDVTGWPKFEMKPSFELYGADGQQQPIYKISVLLPAGSWAWKAAHGVEGEYTHPPRTLEKVYKTLATTNDASGVRVDPVSGQAANGLAYGGAKLSDSGDDPPRRGTLFKREAPDEVCAVTNHDVECPFIVVGTWRDVVLDGSGHTMDYDDGVIALPPHHPGLSDFDPPHLLDASARDSYSLLLSFDKALTDPAHAIEVALARADNGIGLRASLVSGEGIKPHQVMVAVTPPGVLENGVVYTVRYRGAADGQHVDRSWRAATVLAPDALIPLKPLVDRAPPAIVSATATDLTQIVVAFDKQLDPATIGPTSFAIKAAMGSGLTVQSTALQPDRQSVLLVTDRMDILAPYTLNVHGVGDVNDPPNVIGSLSFDFPGFGDRTPPKLARVRAIGAQTLLVRFDEPMDAASAADKSHFSVTGLAVLDVAFAGDPTRRALAFNPRTAPQQRDVVLVHTSAMQAGKHYSLALKGIADLSGNAADLSADFTGVSAPPTVSVALQVKVSDAIRVAGTIPSRALSPIDLAESREGIFAVGSRSGPDNAPVDGQLGPVNAALHGFPGEGMPLAGVAVPLADNGVFPDAAAGDNVFTVLIPDVPLGTTMLWKAFAPFSVAYHAAHPEDSNAAFADGLPGPSVFADGQEFPGNENGVVILDEGATPGLVRLNALFGDETTYKKNTGGPAFFWLTADH